MAKKKKTKAAPKNKKPDKKADKKGVGKKGSANRSLSSREYEKLWKDNKSASNNFEDTEVDEGIYSARLSRCAKGIAKQGKGDHYISFSYVITEGEFEGGKLSAYSSLASEVGTQIAGQTLKKLGYDMDDISFSDLEEIAKDLTDGKIDVEVEVKHKGDRQNTYLRSVLDQ